MVSGIVFFLTFAQLALAGLCYFKEWKELFALLFVHLSPVMVFFGGIETLIKFTGEFSFFFFPALGYCILKYVMLTVSLKNDELGFLNVGALVMEVLYVASSSLYIVYYSYL